MQTKFGSFEFDSNFSLNSLNPDFFDKSLTYKSEISKVIYSEATPASNKEVKFSLFGNYRDNVWNGSLGEKEIISAYGFKFTNSINWTDNN